MLFTVLSRCEERKRRGGAGAEDVLHVRGWNLSVACAVRAVGDCCEGTYRLAFPCPPSAFQIRIAGVRVRRFWFG